MKSPTRSFRIRVLVLAGLVIALLLALLVPARMVAAQEPTDPAVATQSQRDNPCNRDGPRQAR